MFFLKYAANVNIGSNHAKQLSKAFCCILSLKPFNSMKRNHHSLLITLTSFFLKPLTADNWVIKLPNALTQSKTKKKKTKKPTDYTHTKQLNSILYTRVSVINYNHHNVLYSCAMASNNPKLHKHKKKCNNAKKTNFTESFSFFSFG